MSGRAVPATTRTLILMADVNGVRMGVLDDGTAFMSLGGLASFVGRSKKTLWLFAQDFRMGSHRPRESRVEENLRDHSYEGPLFHRVMRNNQEVWAFPEPVCMAILEYYAMQAGQEETFRAKQNLRAIARFGFRKFVYQSVGYDHARKLPDYAREYISRIELNPVPAGRFTVIRETDEFLLIAARAGLPISKHTIPDISVGRHWGRYWRMNDLDAQFGERTKLAHNYPPDYPQALSNPEAWTYPDAALPEFRRWLNEEYAVRWFAPYMNRKVKDGTIPAELAADLILAVESEIVPDGRTLDDHSDDDDRSGPPPA